MHSTRADVPTPSTHADDQTVKTSVDQWVEALESGLYPKGTGCLYRVATGGFCCLGVLADRDGVLNKAHGGVAADGGFFNEVCYEGGGETNEFLNWTPADDSALDVAEQLARLNDSTVTFAPVVAEIRRLHAEWKATR